MDKKYFEDLNKYPPLEKKKEREIALKAKAGDKKSKDLLINSNLRFVISIAKEYKKQGLPLEELVAYGNLGLCKAYDKYDPEKGNKFITYAVWWIRQSILQALNEHNSLIKIPHYQRVSYSLIEKTKENLERKYQREVSNFEVEEELGKKMNLSVAEAYHIIPLDKSYGKHGNYPLKNAIEDTDASDPESFSDHESFFMELEDILKDFTEREKAIIKYYYGIGIVRGLTLEEIGVEFGITRERVRQIKAKVIKRLQHKSRSGRLQPYLAILKSEILNDISGSK